MKCKMLKKFVFFESEDRIIGNMQKLSGHIKIEIRDAMARVYLSINGLESNKEITYGVYLIKYCYKDDGVVFLGDITESAYEVKWCLNPDNVNNSGISIDGFDLCLITVKEQNQHNKDITCPLVAYFTAKKDWRVIFKNYVERIALKEKEAEDLKRKKAIPNKISDKVKNISYTEVGETVQNASESENSIMDLDEKIMGYESEKIQTKESANKELNQIYIDGSFNNKIENYPIINNAYGTHGFPPCYGCIYNRDDLAHSMVKIPNTNANLNSNLNVSRKMEEALDIEAFFKKYFIEYNPFNSKNIGYKWWKAGSPIYLYNILHRYNIKAKEIINPSVIMLHYKYRHLIVGLYSDIERNIKLFICGAPGISRVDENPYVAEGKWVSAEGLQGEGKNFGYWLLYYDINLGKVVNVRT